MYFIDRTLKFDAPGEADVRTAFVLNFEGVLANHRVAKLRDCEEDAEQFRLYLRQCLVLNRNALDIVPVGAGHRQ